MRDDAFDQSIIAIRRSLRTGQNVFRIEDIEALVFHRTHVEVINRNDLEQVEIVLAPVFRFIPPHGAFKRIHGVGAFVLIAWPHPDFQCDIAA